MLYIKSQKEIEKMSEGGKISAKILDKALGLCNEGISTLEIDDEIQRIMKDEGVDPWFNEVDDYPFVSCISVNEVWIHGMPNKKKLQSGDVVSIDTGIKYEDLYLDNCWTVVVPTKGCFNIRECFGEANSETESFLQTGVKALEKAISNFQIGNMLSDISKAIEKTIEDKGYSVVREYGGHGIGKESHEKPFISCFSGGPDLDLEKGMVFAIEVMYAMGDSDIKIENDKWSVKTKDSKLSAMFEHTVALTNDGAKILTK